MPSQDRSPVPTFSPVVIALCAKRGVEPHGEFVIAAIGHVKWVILVAPATPPPTPPALIALGLIAPRPVRPVSTIIIEDRLGQSGVRRAALDVEPVAGLGILIAFNDRLMFELRGAEPAELPIPNALLLRILKKSVV